MGIGTQEVRAGWVKTSRTYSKNPRIRNWSQSINKLYDYKQYLSINLTIFNLNLSLIKVCSVLYDIDTSVKCKL